MKINYFKNIVLYKDLLKLRKGINNFRVEKYVYDYKMIERCCYLFRFFYCYFFY